MDANSRIFFDKQVRWVLKRLPREIRRLLDEVPLRVEDHPALRLRKMLEIRDRNELMGYFSGTPLNAGSVRYESGVTNFITIYRRGIWDAVLDEVGEFDLNELRKQIRITVLHELGHYHGLEEDELEAAGYA